MHRRAALAAGTILASVAAFAVPASAQTVTAVRHASGSEDWGRLAEGQNCAQATAWTARLRKLGIIDKALFETHAPPIAEVPNESSLGDEIINLPGIGVGSKVYTRSMINKVPGNPGEPDISAVCAAYAETGAKRLDAGLPYIPNPIPGGTQLSPVGVHLEAVTTSALALPGKGVELNGTLLTGYISVAGVKVKEFTKDIPPNTGFRVPSDVSRPAIAEVMKDERVSTDLYAKPTVGADGRYVYDPKAPGGYVNAVHTSHGRFKIML